MYRPEIKVCDCTIRDGGLMNDSNFPRDMVRKVFKNLAASGIDIIELGYRNSKKMFDPGQYGLWRFTEDDEIRTVVEGVEYDAKIAVMQDAHKAVAEDVEPKEESPVDIIRVATYVKDVDKAIALANSAVDKGYEATINIMAISNTLERELDEALRQINEETNIIACYIVDSFGALYSEDIDYLVGKYKRFLNSCEVGIHCHNQQQLAYANTIEGIIKNANYVDGTLYGLGRAAGNCPLELLVGFLKNPKFDIVPIFEAIKDEILPLQKEIIWGYNIPYMICGLLNLHPQDAMEVMELPEDDERKYDFTGLYNRLADL